MGGRDNLKPFGPDNPPPPNRGRKKGSRNVSTILREMLEREAPESAVSLDLIKAFCRGRRRVTSADAVAARLLYEALVAGELPAIKELLDRAEGKAKDRRGNVNLNITAQELSDLSDEQLDQLINRLSGKQR